MPAKTLFEKIWNDHVVVDEGEDFCLLHIDRHIVVDLNGRAFEALARRGMPVRNPELTFATADHSVTTDTIGADRRVNDNGPSRDLRDDTARFGVRLFDLGDAGHGIVHVTGPEQGLVLPGMTVVVGDSHTCTNGALGALAWGVGQGELVSVLATQTTRQKRPKTMRITLDGTLQPGVVAKDVILHIIATLSARGGEGHAVEYAGSVIRAMPIEGRMTLCNMTVEFGARFGLIAPDDLTFEYLAGRPFAPQGPAWDAALAYWRGLPSEPEATFDREVTLDVSALEPMVTWGNGLDSGLPVTGAIPDPNEEGDPARRTDMALWLDYMGLRPGDRLRDLRVDRVFIGSCTNSRISDLRAAAALAKGLRVADGVEAWVVPGSRLVKRQAEAEGLDEIFRDAGFRWREPGCSMCIGVNGEVGAPGDRILSTSNRSFAGRQGPGTRTHIAGPLVAVASACTGFITDPRTL